MGKFKDGHEKVGGRKGGSKNKTPANIVQMFEDVFEDIGGREEFAKWAGLSRNQGHFYKLYAKLLPKVIEATIDDNADIKGKLDRARARLNGGV